MVHFQQVHGLLGEEVSEENLRDLQISPSSAEPPKSAWVLQEAAATAWLLLHSWAVGQTSSPPPVAMSSAASSSVG